MMSEVRTVEDRNPECRDPDSPTMRVGGEVLAGFPEVLHPEPMLSLANAFSEEDFLAWHKRMERRVIHLRFTMTAEMKIDGLAVRIRYENGRLALAAIRGNGTEGEDVAGVICTYEPEAFAGCTSY